MMKIIMINNKYKVAIMCILILSIMIRIIFISERKIDQFQYDVGTLKTENLSDYEKMYKREEDVLYRYRHLDYILLIYQNHRLPDTNASQLYHPPLYHVISAAFLRMLDFTNLSSEVKLEALQILPCIYSSITLWIVYEILKELSVEDEYKIICLVLCAFHPLSIYMSGLLNNDTLLTMFSIFSILYMIKWYKDSSYKNAIILAILIGLGTLTKTSMLVNLIIAGIVFFIKMLEIIAREEYKNIKHIILQSIIFSLIAIPLIICFPIRNYQLFGQEPFGILEADDKLYVGNEDIWGRFGILSDEIFNNRLHWKDKNILAYVIKSAIIFSVEDNEIFAAGYLKYISIVIIIVSIIAMIKSILCKDRKNYILLFAYLLWIVSFIVFNIQMPSSCTMHARYIVTAMVITMIFLSIDMQNSNHKIYKIACNLLTIIFCILSTISVLYR